MFAIDYHLLFSYFEERFMMLYQFYRGDIYLLEWLCETETIETGVTFMTFGITIN